MRAAASILLVLLLAGCSDDAAPIDPASVRLQIVAGDGQTAPVIDVQPSAAVVPAAAVAPSAQVSAPITEADLFPEKLVVRAVAATEQARGELSGPSSGGIAAPGVTVTWRVREAEGCGYPVEVSTLTGSNGESVNRWVRGTKAGDCHLDVCRVVTDTGEVVCDQTFTAEQEPGPVAHIWLDLIAQSFNGVDAWFTNSMVLDRHQNRIPWTLEADTDVIRIEHRAHDPVNFDIYAQHVGEGAIRMMVHGATVLEGTVSVEVQPGGTLEFTLHFPDFDTCRPEGYCIS